MNPILRIFSYLRRYPSLAVIQFLCAIISTATVIVFPNIARKIIDEIIPKGDGSSLGSMILLGLAAFFFQEFCESLRIRANNTFEQKVIFDLRSDLYGKIQCLPLRWYDNRSTGDIMTRIIEDVTSVERVLIDGVEQGLIAILQLVIVGVCMFRMHIGLTCAALIPMPFLIAGATYYSLTSRSRHRLVRDATSDMNSVLHDNISGIRQIKSYTLEDSEHTRFNEFSDRLRASTLILMRWWSVYKPGMSFLKATGYLFVLWFGSHACLNHSLSTGELAAFLLLLNLFYEPVSRLTQLNQIVQGSRAAGERVFEILDSEEEPQVKEPIEPKETRGHIRFDGVGFSYTDSLPTIRNVTLEAKPGQTIALVGSTGAGKSTLIHLLTCFYPYDAGSITIDGVPVEKLNRKWLREKIGYVTQESYLFNGTVRDNLRLGKPDATDEEFWRALAGANARAFVERMPDGLDTKVGERGVKLSVGEKQRLSIARVLLKDPPIVLLDEATASVDTETEQQIQQALDHLLAQRTCIVIAHRLSTIRHSDCIYVMDQGQVVESGNHDELLAKGGIYTKLCQTAYL